MDEKKIPARVKEKICRYLNEGVRFDLSCSVISSCICPSYYLFAEVSMDDTIWSCLHLDRLDVDDSCLWLLC